MKSFGQFITEAVKTAASTEAKMKGLKGDGHGGWYDAKGKFVAKTVNGKLQFVQGGKPKEAEGPTSTAPATPDTPQQQAAAPAPMQAAPAQQPVEEPSVENGKAPEEGDTQQQTAAVSYTHLTLPTNREV